MRGLILTDMKNDAKAGEHLLTPLHEPHGDRDIALRRPCHIQGESPPNPSSRLESRNCRELSASRFVAQIFNLLYRRIPFGWALERSISFGRLLVWRIANPRYGRVQLCATNMQVHGEGHRDLKHPTVPAAKVPRALLISLSCLLATSLLLFAGCGKSDSHAGHDSGSDAKVAKYHCPMHPTYTSDKPGNCLICGMKLVPIGDDKSSATAASIPGRTAIKLSGDKRQLIGLTTSPVERRSLSRLVRNPGVVTHDETRYARIAPRFGGWVRSLQVNYTGQPVKKGEPLFTVYSPELFTAENDYLLAFRNAQLSTNSSTTLESSRQLLETARRKLELLQIGAEEIAALERGGKPSDELQIRAPISGHVLTKKAVEGQSFMSGEMLYEIADLSHLWIRASIYESDLPSIKTGQTARAIFPNLNNKAFDTSVSFIYPHIDPQTRRAEVRVELDNPQHEIRPDMWADVEIEVELGELLTVPASSVIDTGTRYVAFVDAENDHLEPREVKIGAKTDDYFEVLDGLKDGEKVVTRALFLVDSESQLKAAISGMGAAGEHKH